MEWRGGRVTENIVGLEVGKKHQVLVVLSPHPTPINKGKEDIDDDDDDNDEEKEGERVNVVWT